MKKDLEENAKRWLIQAQDEYKDACELKKRERYYLALFHFQQSAEKALKSYLYYITASEESFFTHSIYELLEILTEHDREFKQIKNASKLDQYYIITRYPNGLPGGIPSRFFQDKRQANEAMELAEMVIKKVKEKWGLSK